MVPVSSGRATSGARSPTAGMLMAQSVAGDSTTSSRPAPDGDRRVGGRSGRSTARGPARRQRLVGERVGAGRASSRRRRRRRAAAARRGRRPGPAERAGRPRRPGPGRGRARSATGRRGSPPRRPAELRHAPAGRRWPAHGRSGGRPGRRRSTTPVAPEPSAARTASSVSDSSLSGGDRSIGTPAASSAASAVRVERVAVADPAGRSRRPSGRRVARAAVGGDDHARRRRPSRARRDRARRGPARRRRRG